MSYRRQQPTSWNNPTKKVSVSLPSDLLDMLDQLCEASKKSGSWNNPTTRSGQLARMAYRGIKAENEERQEKGLSPLVHQTEFPR